jgi:hypothetical protein
MSQDEPSGPDLDGVVAGANAVGLKYVVIGGFSVVANGFLRATKDSDLLVPDGQETDEAILRFLDRIEASRLRDGKVLTHEDVTGALLASRVCAASSASSVSRDVPRIAGISKSWRHFTASSPSSRFPDSTANRGH